MLPISRQDVLDLTYNNPGLMAKVYTDFNFVLKSIKEQNLLDIIEFYEKIRKSYNQKHSKCYINIMKEIEEPQKVLTTLSSLLTQILLFAEDAKDKKMFLKHSKFREIVNCLNSYGEDQNLQPSIDLIKDVKKDIKYFENI